jgi:hypothetical protein
MAKNRRNRRKQPKHTNWIGRTPPQDRLPEHQLQQTQATNLALRVRRLAEHATIFFSPAGAVIEHQELCVLINGDPVMPGGSGTLDVIDEVGLRHYGKRLQDTANNELAQQIPKLTVRMRSRLLEIQRDGQRVGLIKPTHANVEADHAQRIDGNFLLAGHPCWEELRVGLGGAAPTTVLIELPAIATALERRRAIAASTRIRENRSRDFAARVRIHREVDGTTIAFQKISISQPIEVAFELTNQDGSTLRAALRLSGAGLVLPLSIATPAPDSAALVTEWLIALETFAHLTSIDPDTARHGEKHNDKDHVLGQRAGARPDQTRDGQVRQLRPPETPRAASPSEIPPDLVPTVITAHALAHHHVVGHPRQLPSGNQPDPEKVRAAGARGIRLAPGFTWVKSHWRGSGNDPELEFNWHTGASSADLSRDAA